MGLFGSIRNAAARLVTKIRNADVKTSRYQGPPVRLVTRHEQLALALAAARAILTEHPQHYPEWRSKRKTTGQRDRSLRQRSNRRHAARKAA